MSGKGRVPVVVQGAGPKGSGAVYVDMPENELWKLRVAMQLNPMLYPLEEVEDVEKRCEEFEKKRAVERT